MFFILNYSTGSYPAGPPPLEAQAELKQCRVEDFFVFAGRLQEADILETSQGLLWAFLPYYKQMEPLLFSKLCEARFYLMSI